MAILNLAEYKATTGAIGITNDTLVNTLIPIIQSQIETYLDRKLDTQVNYEWKSYSPTMILEQYPVTKLTFIGSMYNIGTFSPSTGYNFQINNNYFTDGTPTGLTITKDSDFTSNTISFTTAPHLEELQTQVEALYPGMTINIVSGYEMTNYRLFKPGTGKDIYGAVRVDANTRLINNRTLEFLQDASFLFLATCDLISDVQMLVMYETGYATADVPKAIKLVASNVIKDIVNVQTSGQATPGARAGIYNSENWSPDTRSYNYQTDDINGLAISKMVAKYENELFPFKKKVI